MHYAFTRETLQNKTLAIALILGMVMWALWVPLTAHAVTLLSVKDTLTDSRPSTLTRHVINFTTSNAATTGQTIKIQLDPSASAFTEAFSTATTTDITVSGATLVTTCGAGTDEVTVVGNYNGGSDENLTFTVCSGDTVPAGAIVVTVGAASTNLWTNPSGTGSYVVRIAGTMTDTGDLRVAIIDAVTVTASVNTTLTFSVAGKTSGTVNGEGTSCGAAATATALPFGTLAIATPQVLCQTLSVTTNARNGFSVTVVQNQNLLSANGADVDAFKDGNGQYAPTAWSSPTNVLDSENTYGHLGLTSEDSTLAAGDEYGTALYSAIGTSTPRSIFYHTGPADGSTTDKGQTNVAYKVEIASLQEAATDYNNRLTYVATPTF